jgi:hypothetical protein
VGREAVSWVLGEGARVIERTPFIRDELEGQVRAERGIA